MSKETEAGRGVVAAPVERPVRPGSGASERLRQYIQKASFSSSADKFSALQCLADLEQVLTGHAETLDLIVRRLQADIDDGSRPDQWSMEELVRKAKTTMHPGCLIGGPNVEVTGPRVGYGSNE